MIAAVTSCEPNRESSADMRFVNAVGPLVSQVSPQAFGVLPADVDAVEHPGPAGVAADSLVWMFLT